MKKNSKIFAILLTFCLLLGAVSVFAFASEVKDPLDASQYGDGIKSQYIIDAESFVDLSEAELSAKLKNGALTNPAHYGSGGNFYDGAAKVALKGAAGNMYVGVKSTISEQQTTTHGNCFYGVFIGTAKDTMQYYDYYVASVDFMADDIHADGSLSYLEHSYLGAYSAALNYKCVYFVKDAEGNWYIADKKDISQANRKVALEKEVGAWNNYTIVFSRATKSGGIYVNGQCVLPLSSISTGVYVDRIVLNLSGATKGYFSVGFDNGCAAAYGSYTYDDEGTETSHIPYNSGAKFGLDDYFAIGDTNLNIDFCEDIVANHNYGFNTLDGKGYNAAIVSGDDRTEFYSAAQALYAAQDGDVIEIDNSVAVPYLECGKSVTVIANNGATVSVNGRVSIAEAKDSDGKSIYKLAGLSTNVDNAYGSHFSSSFSVSGWGNSGVITTAVNNGVLNVTATNTTADATVGSNNDGRKYFLLTSKTGLLTEMAHEYSHWLLEFDIGLLPGGEYCDGMSISIFDNKLAAYYDAFFTVTDGQGNWYLSSTATYSAETAAYQLPSEAGVSTHITVIAYVNRQTNSDSGYYVYANGEYVNRASHYTTGATKIAGTNMHPERFCFDLSKGLLVSKNVAFYIDNYDIFRYGSTLKNGTPYNSGAVFGIDDYIALGDMTLPIYHCLDTVAASCASGEFELNSDGLVNKFENVASALAFAADRDTLTVPDDVTLISVLNSDVKTLRINGGDVTFAGDAARFYSFADGVVSGLNFYLVHWYDLDGNYVRTSILPLSDIPDFSVWDLADGRVVGNSNIPAAWNASVNGADSVNYTECEAPGNGDIFKMSPAVVKVIWYQKDGSTVDETELWFMGNELTRSLSNLNATLPVLDNGWYELSYFWNSSKYDMTARGEVMELKPVIEPISALDMKFNFMLGASAYPIFYIPKEIEGVNIDKMYVNPRISVQNQSGDFYTSLVGPITDIHELSAWTGTSAALEEISAYKTECLIDGQSYYRYQSTGVSAFAWYTVTGFQTEFTVTYNGVEYSVHSKPALVCMGSKSGAVSYSSKILNYDGSKPCSNETMLLLNWLQYISYSYAAQSTNVMLSAAEQILSGHLEKNPGCTCLHSIEDMIPTDDPGYSGFEGLENVGASYLITKDNGLLVLYVPKEYVPEDRNVEVYATLKGIVYNPTTGTTQTGRVVKVPLNMNMVEQKPYETADGCYLFIIKSAEAKICNVNEEVTLTIKVDGEIIGTATYSLKAYIYNTLQKNNLYELNAETGKYELNTEVLTLNGDKYKYTTSQRAYQATLALAAFGEAAYDYMTYGTDAAR